MIYELSYGKWGPLVFLTLQDVVAYQFLLWTNEGGAESLIPKCPYLLCQPGTNGLTQEPWGESLPK